MADNKDSSAAWTEFKSDMRSLAGELRRHYHGTDEQKETAEINRSLQELGAAADAFFASLDTASRDPEVRSSTRRAASSFGAALRETLHDVGDELEKAFRDRDSKPKG